MNVGCLSPPDHAVRARQRHGVRALGLGPARPDAGQRRDGHVHDARLGVEPQLARPPRGVAALVPRLAQEVRAQLAVAHKVRGQLDVPVSVVKAHVVNRQSL